MVRSLIVRFVFLVAPTAICASGYAQIPPIPSSTQRSIERIVGISGSYAANESVFKIRIPRTDITLNLQGRGVTTGFELQLLEGEVNPVASAALDSGLNITGLGNTMLFDQPRVLTMNLSGTGSFDKLASGIRKCLDSISAAGAGKTGAAVRSEFPATSTIEGGPIDTILSMKGTLTNGIYRAAIGQITVLNNTPFGKEMGAVTSVVFSGTNQNAMVQGEIVVTVDQLQGVLKALRSKRLDLISIRNHTIAEHPQLVFVRFQGNGSAADLAKAVRYALDVQVGAVKPPA